MTPEHKRRLWSAVYLLAGLNFMAFLVGTAVVGEALSGYVDNGHYYVYSKFHGPDVYVEVSRAVYTYSWWHGASAFASLLLVAVSAAMLSDYPPTVANLKADLKELPHALTPMRLAIFARALWGAVGSHWRELVPFWFAPTYFLLMWKLGSPLFGRVLTGSVLVPLPTFWAFLRASRLFAHGEISFAQCLAWIILMPFLVLVLLMPLLKPVLAPGTG